MAKPRQIKMLPSRGKFDPEVAATALLPLFLDYVKRKNLMGGDLPAIEQGQIGCVDRCPASQTAVTSE